MYYIYTSTCHIQAIVCTQYKYAYICACNLRASSIITWTHGWTYTLYAYDVLDNHFPFQYKRTLLATLIDFIACIVYHMYTKLHTTKQTLYLKQSTYQETATFGRAGALADWVEERTASQWRSYLDERDLHNIYAHSAWYIFIYKNNSNYTWYIIFRYVYQIAWPTY
jgi:hypothetical protein